LTLRFWILVVLIVLVVVTAVFAIPRLEGTAPTIGELPSVVLGREPRTLTLEIADEDSGLRSVSLRILSSGGSQGVAERHFPGSLTSGGDTRSEVLEVALDPDELGLADGTATLVVVARDWSLRDGFGGNSVERSVPIRIDSQPPRVGVAGGLIYVYRGGSAAVSYTLGEPAPEHGVRVGDVFFPGHPLDDGDADSLERIAIFAIPVGGDADPSVRVVARDEAGNETAVEFALRIFERQFSDSTIELSRSFLDRKVVPLAKANGLTGGDLAESFKNVNETLRELNEARIREVVSEGSSQRRWQGAFQQMTNSQVTSRFAEQRTYVWDARPISRAVHYGFDLASTSGAAVTAANAGVVVLAEDLGIYGQCVLIDHGLGVHSLYGHLSQLQVAVGDSVRQGQSLGRSGASGLAGGDHLHFAILVGGRYVDPLEWWDPKWVHDHVEWRFQQQDAPPG